MAQAVSDVIERLALALATRSGAFTHEESVEFGQALVDLADRIERAVEVLRELIETVKPDALPENLHLTPRELEILGQLGEGRSNTEIAKQCWISENTVKFHLKNLFKKLGIRDRGQAMMIARAARRKLDHPPRQE